MIADRHSPDDVLQFDDGITAQSLTFTQSGNNVLISEGVTGDSILFGKYSGTEIKIDGEDFIIMREEEVLGVLSGAAKKETAGSRR